MVDIKNATTKLNLTKKSGKDNKSYSLPYFVFVLNIFLLNTSYLHSLSAFNNLNGPFTSKNCAKRNWILSIRLSMDDG